MMRWCRQALKKVGGLVLIEKRVLDTMRVRPDLDVIIDGRSYLIDVVVTHPSAPSKRGVEPLSAAIDSEAYKVDHYQFVAQMRKAVVLGFALETYGAFGPQAIKVLKLLEQAGSGRYS